MALEIALTASEMSPEPVLWARGSAWPGKMVVELTSPHDACLPSEGLVGALVSDSSQLL